jgi:hypothetical protein
MLFLPRLHIIYSTPKCMEMEITLEILVNNTHHGNYLNERTIFCTNIYPEVDIFR